jgi:mRNA guanylyltransferase
MLNQINPLSDVLDVEELLTEHPDTNATRLAQAQCGALKRFMESKAKDWNSAIASSGPSPLPPPSMSNINFPGCMPVNFSRHNIEEVQRSENNAYFLSEKTDGVRYFMVFTGTSCVLIDRRMKGKQPKPRPGGAGENGNSPQDPMSPVIPYIQQGAVLDGEVVMHRKLRRPIFIVFDVLALSATQPVLHLPFEQRKAYLDRAEFQIPSSPRNVFNKADVLNPKIALPLVRKNFVTRMELDTKLLGYVTEEKGMRCYKFEDSHHHLTDGIIFQPNLPYVCGTDVNLLKWKYLDTVTIDVELLPPIQNFHNNNNNEDVLRVGVLGDEGSIVDMTRHIHLPPSERRRLEADRNENGAKIAEVGFEPTTGEWYYLTMRPDKETPNHISTVLGTLLELAESLSTEELRYRMSVPPGGSDTWRKQTRKMQRQLLDHQREQNKSLFRKR